MRSWRARGLLHGIAVSCGSRLAVMGHHIDHITPPIVARRMDPMPKKTTSKKATESAKPDSKASAKKKSASTKGASATTKKATAKKATTKKATTKKAPAGATVADMMSGPVHRVDASASLNEAAHLMWEHDIGVVPVVDIEGRVEGVVTDRDIAMAAYLQGRALRTIPVREIMSTSVQTVRSDEPVVQASYKMAQHQMRRLPVLDNEGVLVGMLSLNDLAEASGDAKDARVTEHDVADTLRAVCMPRAKTEPLPAS